MEEYDLWLTKDFESYEADANAEAYILEEYEATIRKSPEEVGDAVAEFAGYSEETLQRWNIATQQAAREGKTRLLLLFIDDAIAHEAERRLNEISNKRN